MNWTKAIIAFILMFIASICAASIFLAFMGMSLTVVSIVSAGISSIVFSIVLSRNG